MRASPLLSLLVLPLLVACHGGPTEPVATAPSASARASVPRRRETHHVIFQDHRHVVPLQRGDRFVLPDDPAFAWHAEFEDKTAFARVTDEDAGGAEVYTVTKAGPLRVMIFGNPKECMHSDAACTISKRRWDVTFAVP